MALVDDLAAGAMSISRDLAGGDADLAGRLGAAARRLRNALDRWREMRDDYPGRVEVLRVLDMLNDES